MIFFAYIAALSAYVLITALALFYVPTRFQGKRRRMAAFLIAFTVFVLAPGGWIYYERSYFDRLCEREAGVTIYRTVEGVDGFYLQGGGWGAAVKDFPYRYIEVQKYDGKIDQYTLNPNGQVVKLPLGKPSSRYAVIERRESLPTRVQRVEFTVIDRTNNETLARKVEFNRGSDFLRPWLSIASCPNAYERNFKDFLTSALKPATATTH